VSRHFVAGSYVPDRHIDSEAGTSTYEWQQQNKNATMRLTHRGWVPASDALLAMV
jgi:hypothetical protein